MALQARVLGIIPARSGSKGVPGKNIKTIASKPLIAWTIKAAQESQQLDRLIVSTDSEEIAKVARAYGAVIPFLRPEELAQDDTPAVDVAIHALEWLEKFEQYIPEFILWLQPTSPLRGAADIHQAMQIALTSSAEAVIGVTHVKHHPYWTKTISPEGYLMSFSPDSPLPTDRQHLPGCYAPNGAIFLVRSDALKQQRTFYPQKSVPYVMPQERSLDIDTNWDFYLAELVLKDQIQ